MTVTPARLVEALADWRCDPTPLGVDWSKRTTPGDWTPAGVLHHHTGGSARLLTDAAAQQAMLEMLRDGRPDLPGPLCHLAPAMVPGRMAARVHLVGWGNVNHAGRGCAVTLGAVRRGAYRPTRPGPDTVDGNPWLWAFEYLHPGVAAVAWPDELLEVGHRAACAVAQVSGWPRDTWAGRVLEHRQWTLRKIDRSWTGRVQDAVARLAERGPDVTISDADRKAIFDADVVPTTIDPDGKAYLGQDPGNPTVQVDNALGAILAASQRSRQLAGAAKAAAEQSGADLAALRAEVEAGQAVTLAKLDAIAAAVAALASRGN